MQNQSANAPPTPGARMNVHECTIRGKTRYRIETTSGGVRKRQFFRTRSAAEDALSSARKHCSQLGRAFELLTPAEKANVMAILQDIRQAGYTLAGVWEAARSNPATPKAPCTLKVAFAEMLAAKREANCRPRHIGNMEWYIGKFISGRQEQPVSSIGPDQINAWFEARQEAPRSKKGHISLLSIFFAFAIRKGYVNENPVKRLDPVHIDRQSPSLLTVAQCRRSLAWVRKHKPKALAWFVLALFCGLRPDSEADFISWKDIDLKRGRIIVGRSKIRTIRHRILDHLAFCPPLLPWLKTAKKLRSELPIHFESRRRAVRALRDHLRFERWPQDILRHTAASNLIAFHQDAGKVAEFLGNSAGVLLRDYKALVFKEDAEKFLSLLP